jgi:hypothetical protein
VCVSSVDVPVDSDVNLDNAGMAVRATCAKKKTYPLALTMMFI